VAARPDLRFPDFRHRLLDLSRRLVAILLERMRAEEMLDRVAVVMCSTSTHEEDISRA
jgi:hypothetical protein